MLTRAGSLYLRLCTLGSHREACIWFCLPADRFTLLETITLFSTSLSLGRVNVLFVPPGHIESQMFWFGTGFCQSIHLVWGKKKKSIYAFSYVCCSLFIQLIHHSICISALHSAHLQPEDPAIFDSSTLAAFCVCQGTVRLETNWNRIRSTVAGSVILIIISPSAIVMRYAAAAISHLEQITCWFLANSEVTSQQQQSNQMGISVMQKCVVFMVCRILRRQRACKI